MASGHWHRASGHYHRASGHWHRASGHSDIELEVTLT
jgi:hypothetical protein